MVMKQSEINRACDKFFQKMDNLGIALTFGDVRLKTDYSEVVPREVNIQSRFSRRIPLKSPIVSSPMDTVTEYKMAITMALAGGLGIIHKALSPKRQAAMVAKVKHYLGGFIANPICVHTEDTIESVLKMKAEKDFSFFSFPVLDGLNKVVGLVTSNDFDFAVDRSRKILEIMSTDIIRADSSVSPQEAYQEMIKNRKKILPVLDSNGNLSGLYTWKDLKRIYNRDDDSENYNLDEKGRLLVGAAVGVGADLAERMEILSKEEVDVVVIDTAHGDSQAVIEAVQFCKKYYPNIDVVAGNISEGKSAERLVGAGADGIRVGQGPGSICTTRVVAGIGCPQVTAVYNCEKAIRSSGVPICADGGIEFSGDISIALAAGASSVMLGKLLAGTTESPGTVIYKNGRAIKNYRGMGSLGAMLDNQASRERYGQSGSTADKLVPEGIEGEVDYKGHLSLIINQLLGGLRSGMGYLGAKNIPALQEKADFNRISGIGLKESHPHGLTGIKDAPNYKGSGF